VHAEQSFALEERMTEENVPRGHPVGAVDPCVASSSVLPINLLTVSESPLELT
jgi:hypothetical protein